MIAIFCLLFYISSVVSTKVVTNTVSLGDPATDKLGQQIAGLFDANINLTAKNFPLPCPYLRQAHTKSHGCLVGKLIVDQNLPLSLSTGLFNVTAQGNTHDVLIRFSNGKGNGFVNGNPVADDDSQDVRGMALKMFGVKGSKLHQPNAETVDMLAITSDSLFMDEMSDALPFFTAVNKNSSFTFYSYLLTHPIVAARLLKFASSGTTFELTQKPFFTVAPLTLGGLAAKFGFFPCSSNLDVNPLDTTSFSYLAANLRTYFAKQQLSACWNISAQLFVNNKMTPIDDLSSPWNVPWQPIGSLVIHPQDVWSSAAKATMCEQVAFHPHQTLLENAPQGWVQEIRKIVMTTEQNRRHYWNKQQQQDWTAADLANYVVA